MKTQNVTKNGILRIIRRGPKVKSVVLHTKTKPELLKKGRESGTPNDFGTIYHIQKIQALLGTSYEDFVNQRWIQSALNHLELSGDIPRFEAQALWNGKGIHDGLYTVRHRPTGRRYLYFYPLRQGDSVYVNENGEDIPKHQLGEFLKLRGVPRSGETWRTVALENIMAIQYDSKFFDLCPEKCEGTVQTDSLASAK